MRTYALPLGITAYAAESGDAEAFLDWHRRRRPYLGLDIETAGLAPTDPVRLVQFGDADEAWVLHAERDRALIRDALRQHGQRYVLWNGSFDLNRLADLCGLDFEELLARSSDTQVLAGVLDPRFDYQGGVGHGMKAWAVHLLGPDAGRPAEELDRVFADRGWGGLRSTKGRGWAEVEQTHPAYLRYAAADPVLTVRIHQRLAEQLRPRAAVVRREQTVARVVARIERRGFLLDPEHTERVRSHYAAEVADTAEKLAALGVSKAGSTKQVAQRLRDEGLEDVIRRTEAGNDSVDKAALKRAHNLGSDAANLVLRHKKAKRFSRGFAETYQAAAAHDGRVRPGLRSIGTKTRRMTCSAPNLQQVPKPKKGEAVIVRDCFIPDPGETLLAVDYEQMELRFAASLTRDARLARDIEAADMFVDLAEKVWPGNGKAYRQQAKIATYSLMYGVGPRSLAGILGLPEQDARRLRDTFWRTYRVLHERFEAASRKVSALGGIELERSGWLPSDKQRGYVGLNLLIQGGCRDAFGERLVAMDAAGLTPYMRLLVHDEAIFSVPTAEVGDVRRVVEDVMPIRDLALPVGVSVSEGSAWGSAYL